jgi:hypothetical protein
MTHQQSKSNQKLALFRFIVIVFIIFCLFLFIPKNQENAINAQGSIELDYIILIDISGSMDNLYNPNDSQSSNLWDDLIPVIKDYIQNLPLGANVKIYTFGTTIKEYGPWSGIQERDKTEIIETVNGLKPNEEYTKFWDTVCEAVDYMDDLQADQDAERFQTLISFTDGQDNISTNRSTDCLTPYEELCVEGGVYWLHYAYGESETFKDEPCTKVISVENFGDPSFQPNITSAFYLPSTLNLGNLYGQDDVESKCFLFYASSSEIFGNQGYKLGSPKLVDGNLPSGVALKVCESGNSACNRENIVITQNESCLDFSLINYDPSQISSSRTIVFDIPITRSDNSDNYFIVYPETFKVVFDLDPVPSDTPTFTDTPSATVTLTPTITPSLTPTLTLTPTPIPMSIAFDCGEGDMIDFGTIKKPDDGQSVQLEHVCGVNWGEGELPPDAQVSLSWDDEDQAAANLAQYVWLQKDGAKTKTIALSPNDQDFKIVVDMPYEAWEGLSRDSFTGGVVLAVTAGDSSIENLSTMGVDFKVQPPLSPAFYAIPAVALLALAGLVVVGTRPRFPKDVQVENMGQTISPSSSINDWWTGSIYLGGGAKAALGLGKENELLVKMTPNGKGSLIGKIFNKNAEFSAEITPLSTARIKMQTEAMDTIESRTIYEGSEFGVINGDQYYPIRILIEKDQELDKDPFGRGYKEDPFGGF